MVPPFGALKCIDRLNRSKPGTGGQMKLKTCMSDMPTGPQYPYGPIPSLQHDAAVAHALLQAMEGSPAEAGIQHLAAEILAEWGIEDDESN